MPEQLKVIRRELSTLPIAGSAVQKAALKADYRRLKAQLTELEKAKDEPAGAMMCELCVTVPEDDNATV